MTRRTPREEIALETVDESSPEQRTLALIDGILSESGDNSGLKIMVKELIPEPGKRNPAEAWLFDVEPDEMDDLRRRLLEECGPGNYRVRVLGGDRKQIAQYDVSVAKPKRVREQERAAALAPRTPAPAPEDPLQKLLLDRLEKLERTQNATTGVLEAIAARLAAPPPVAVAPISSLKETIETMGAMIALFPRPDANIGLNMFNQGLDMAKKIYELRGEGGESDGGLTGILTKALESPLLAGLVQNATNAQRQNGHRQPTPEPLRMPGAATAAPAANPAAGVDPRSVSQLAETMNYLIIKASENVSPALCIDYLEENLPDDAWTMLQQSPDPIGELAKIFPAVTTYRPWFNALLDKLAEPVETEGDAGGGRHAMRMQQPRV